jgi:hypothetical protein
VARLPGCGISPSQDLIFSAETVQDIRAGTRYKSDLGRPSTLLQICCFFFTSTGNILGGDLKIRDVSISATLPSSVYVPSGFEQEQR